jgi:hypothetical protein
MAMTETERAVADVWSEALGMPVAEPDANFFDLGGHSLLAARTIPRLSEAVGVKLTVRYFMTHPTVRGLAAEVDRALRAPNGPVGPAS